MISKTNVVVSESLESSRRNKKAINLDFYVCSLLGKV